MSHTHKTHQQFKRPIDRAQAASRTRRVEGAAGHTCAVRSTHQTTHDAQLSSHTTNTMRATTLAFVLVASFLSLASAQAPTPLAETFATRLQQRRNITLGGFQVTPDQRE